MDANGQQVGEQPAVLGGRKRRGCELVWGGEAKPEKNVLVHLLVHANLRNPGEKKGDKR